MLRKLKVLTITSLLMLSVIGCASVPVNDYCLIAKEIHIPPDDIDGLSDELIISLYDHNKTFEVVCLD